MHKTKTCSKCKKEKSTDRFNVRESSSDGLQSQCKDCTMSDAKARREKAFKRFSELATVPTILLKVCDKCKIKKPIGEFYKSSILVNGQMTHSKRCKVCEMKRHRNKKQSYKLPQGSLKYCRKCQKKKSTEEFYKDCHSKDGLKTLCKICEKEYRETRKYPVSQKIFKICRKCEQEKATVEFRINPSYIDGRINICKTCERKYFKQRLKRNKRRLDATSKQKILSTKICYKCQKKKPTKEFFKTYNTKDGFTGYCKICFRKYHIQYASNRKKTDPSYRLRTSLGNTLRSHLKCQNAKKSDHTMILTGCSIKFLKKYIEDRLTKGMTWENYGVKGWHIDHIKPCASFDLTKPEEQRKCFHYTNLQPMWWFDNFAKNSFYNGKRIRKNKK